jgi:hypothetical protein
MRESQIISDLDALIYITECTLATVEYMMDLKSKSKSEFERQIGIAQIGINHIRQYPISNIPNGRVKELLIDGKGNVKEYTQQKINKYANN